MEAGTMLLFLSGGGGGHAYSENCTHGVSWSVDNWGKLIEPQHHNLYCTMKLSKSPFLIAIAYHLGRNYISIAYFQYRWQNLGRKKLYIQTKKEWYSQIFFYIRFVQKVCVFDTISKRNKCSFCCFLNHTFYFVNQELCHVLCDEAKSRLCHFVYLS